MVRLERHILKVTNPPKVGSDFHVSSHRYPNHPGDTLWCTFSATEHMTPKKDECLTCPRSQDMSGFRERVISLNKQPGQTFGFYLRLEHGEEGHLIRCLEMGGPAELAGMKDGDRILRVNGTFVDGMSHSEVRHNRSSNDCVIVIRSEPAAGEGGIVSFQL